MRQWVPRNVRSRIGFLREAAVKGASPFYWAIGIGYAVVGGSVLGTSIWGFHRPRTGFEIATGLLVLVLLEGAFRLNRALKVAVQRYEGESAEITLYAGFQNKQLNMTFVVPGKPRVETLNVFVPKLPGLDIRHVDNEGQTNDDHQVELIAGTPSRYWWARQFRMLGFGSRTHCSFEIGDITQATPVRLMYGGENAPWRVWNATIYPDGRVVWS